MTDNLPHSAQNEKAASLRCLQENIRRIFCGYFRFESLFLSSICTNIVGKNNDSASECVSLYYKKEMCNTDNENKSPLTEKEKKIKLFLSQKATLDTFLEKRAISKSQYDKSLGTLIEKMNINPEDLPQ